jgi:hypothetical protein
MRPRRSRPQRSEPRLTTRKLKTYQTSLGFDHAIEPERAALEKRLQAESGRREKQKLDLAVHRTRK